MHFSIQVTPPLRHQMSNIKLMVWLAASAPYVHKNKIAINGKTYLEECIQRRLIPFIKQNHFTFLMYVVFNQWTYIYNLS